MASARRIRNLKFVYLVWSTDQQWSSIHFDTKPSEVTRDSNCQPLIIMLASCVVEPPKNGSSQGVRLLGQSRPHKKRRGTRSWGGPGLADSQRTSSTDLRTGGACHKRRFPLQLAETKIRGSERRGGKDNAQVVWLVMMRACHEVLSCFEFRMRDPVWPNHLT